MTRRFRTLALETAGGGCSVALLLDGELDVRQTTEPVDRSRTILREAAALLSAAQIELSDLDCIAFGKGPGSFTGVRIAAAAAQGLAFGGGLPAVAVSTLAALARSAADQAGDGIYAACLDARQDEFYVGVYACNGSDHALSIEADRLVKPDSWSPGADLKNPVLAVGSGWSAWPGGLDPELKLTEGPKAAPGAGEIARLAMAEFFAGNKLNPAEALPNYLRHRVSHS